MIFWWLWIKTQTLHAFSLVCWNIIWWHIFLICFCLLGWYQPFLILQMLGRLEIEMTISMGILDKDIDRCYCIYLLVIFYLVLLSNFSIHVYSLYQHCFKTNKIRSNKVLTLNNIAADKSILFWTQYCVLMHDIDFHDLLMIFLLVLYKIGFQSCHRHQLKILGDSGRNLVKHLSVNYRGVKSPETTTITSINTQPFSILLHCTGIGDQYHHHRNPKL